MGLEPIESLPAQTARPHKPSIAALFQKRYVYITSTLTIAYFTLIMAFYFIMKWTPKIVVDLGFDQASAGSVLVFASVGSLLGAVTLGLMSSRIRLRPTVIAVMIVAFAFFGLFGMGHTDLARLSLFAAIAIFFTNAAVVGMYPIMAKSFPAELRASGIGFAIGVGRGGSALGPLIAGLLFEGGSSLLTVSLIMGGGTLVAALMILILPIAPQLDEVGQ
jgi:cyanate permease